MRTVVLAGTAHSLQCLGRNAEAANVEVFKGFLRRLCGEHGVRAIAEEMSEAALEVRGAKESVAQIICRELRLAHCFADPGPDERTRLGVRDVHDVKLEGIHRDWSSEQTEAELRKTHGIRECYWLGQIQSLGAWPVLFVCGADHVEPFSTLLSTAGIHVVTACDDWKPSASLDGTE